MITYNELFLLLTLIVSIIALVVNITKKEITALSERLFSFNNYFQGLTVYR